MLYKVKLLTCCCYPYQREIHAVVSVSSFKYIGVGLMPLLLNFSKFHESHRQRYDLGLVLIALYRARYRMGCSWQRRISEQGIQFGSSAIKPRAAAFSTALIYPDVTGVFRPVKTGASLLWRPTNDTIATVGNTNPDMARLYLSADDKQTKQKPLLLFAMNLN